VRSSKLTKMGEWRLNAVANHNFGPLSTLGQ
jgi:hypothetical protein